MMCFLLFKVFLRPFEWLRPGATPSPDRWHQPFGAEEVTDVHVFWWICLSFLGFNSRFIGFLVFFFLEVCGFAFLVIF